MTLLGLADIPLEDVDLPEERSDFGGMLSFLIDGDVRQQLCHLRQMRIPEKGVHKGCARGFAAVISCIAQKRQVEDLALDIRAWIVTQIAVDIPEVVGWDASCVF